MTSDLEGIVSNIPDFFNWTDTDKIKFFAWFAISIDKKPRFNSTDIAKYFDELSMNKPTSVSAFVNALIKKKPAEVLRDSGGYYLERRVKNEFDEKYGKRQATIKVDKLLSELPAKLSSNIEKIFLEEAISCFQVKAFRAAIVMTWNLAYDHLCNYLINDSNRLLKFNTQLPKSFPKARISCITNRDDFSEIKESEVLQVFRSSNILTNDLYKILKEKLDKRNTAAHPSTVQIFPNTAEEFIIDLVNNVVLKLT